MKHTKGQWYTSGKSINNADQHLIISEDKGQNVAICYGVSNSEEAEANAHLMTAAPELLEACKGAEQALKDIIGAADNDMPYTRDELVQNFMDDYNKLLTAINKAEGA